MPGVHPILEGRPHHLTQSTCTAWILGTRSSLWQNRAFQLLAWKQTLTLTIKLHVTPATILALHSADPKNAAQSARLFCLCAEDANLS